MQLNKALGRAEDINLFPRSALKIRTVVTSPRTSFEDLERAVSIDPALSAQVLKVANSPYFGVSRQIRDLRQALVLIGYEATRDLALALALLTLAQQESGPSSALYDHSLSAALCARLLADKACPQLAGEAFVAGLLHDLGKLIGRLVHESADEYPWAVQSDEASLALEQQACGFTHAELGAACLERWNLGESTCLAIRNHHRPMADPVESEAGILARVVHLANEVAHRPVQPSDTWASVVQRLALDAHLTVEQVQEAAKQAPSASEKLGLG